MHVTVVHDHEIPARPAIRIVPGDTVAVGKRDTEWPAFVFIAMAEGSGWVPERHLTSDRPTARAIHAYDTQELHAATGAVLTLVEDDPDSGWAWCVSAEGQAGCVPYRALEFPS